MPNETAQQMLEDKKKRSPFLTLSDGEEQEGKILEIKNITKAGFSGEEEDFLRVVLECNIEGVGVIKKNFDNSSKKWLEEVVKKEIDTGDIIKISREGERTKTTYTIDIISKGDGNEPAQSTDEIKPEDIPM